MTTQLRMDIPLPTIAGPAQFAAACSQLSEALGGTDAVLLGGRAVAVVRSPAGPDLAVSLAASTPLLAAVHEVAIDLGNTAVTSMLVGDDDDAWISVRTISAVDRAVVADLAAHVHGWAWAGTAAMEAISGCVPARLHLDRMAWCGTLLAGAHVRAGHDLAAAELVADAEHLAGPGEWQLLGAAAAQAVLSHGYSSVFEEGERIEPALTWAAAMAVNAALVHRRARDVGTSAQEYARRLATHGPSCLARG